MTQRKARRELKRKLISEQGYYPEEAEDLIQECQYQIIDFYDGKRDYKSIEEILQDYLMVGEEWMDAFKDCL